MREARGLLLLLRRHAHGGNAELDAWADRKGEAGLIAYRREKNARSIDGLPGLQA